jgi:hypothetical protein
MRIGPAVACLLTASLVGCARPSPPSTTVGAAPSYSAFDGVYRATVTVTKVGSAAAGYPTWCDTQAHASLNVATNRFSLALPHPNMPGNPTVNFAVAIAPNGSFHTQSIDGTTMFTGQVNGGHLQGFVNGVSCQYTVSADRQ